MNVCVTILPTEILHNFFALLLKNRFQKITSAPQNDRDLFISEISPQWIILDPIFFNESIEDLQNKFPQAKLLVVCEANSTMVIPKNCVRLEKPLHLQHVKKILEHVL